MAKKTKATAPARADIPAAVLELRQSTLREYWRRNAEADELESAAWRAPSPETAFAALTARMAQNTAWVAYNRACGGTA